MDRPNLCTALEPHPFDKQLSTSPEMAITILAPAPVAQSYDGADSSDSDSENGGADLQGDINMRPKKRARHDHEDLVTPGDIVTDEDQWMR